VAGHHPVRPPSLDSRIGLRETGPVLLHRVRVLLIGSNSRVPLELGCTTS